MLFPMSRTTPGSASTAISWSPSMTPGCTARMPKPQRAMTAMSRRTTFSGNMRLRPGTACGMQRYLRCAGSRRQLSCIKLGAMWFSKIACAVTTRSSARFRRTAKSSSSREDAGSATARLRMAGCAVFPPLHIPERRFLRDFFQNACASFLRITRVN